MTNRNNNKNQAISEAAIPIPILQMRITVLNNGTLSVAGIPSKLETALKIMADANKAIVEHFIGKAKAGELDDKNTTIEKRIIIQDKKIIM